MASIVSNLEENTDRSRESKRKKRRRIESVGAQDQSNKKIRWRSSAEQSTYSSKLVEALRRVRRTSSPASTVSSRSRAVRETADKILAIAARGRSRWSRAILANRLKLQLKNHKKAAKSNKSTQAASTCNSRLNILENGAHTNRLPPLQRRVRVLGRLVPGCRKLSFPSLLEETTDYISALEMQVRAMSALAELLTGATSGTSAGTSNSDRPDLT
ncbi:hypothetical protein V2J09_007834 [Rumex salicifolius]